MLGWTLLQEFLVITCSRGLESIDNTLFCKNCPLYDPKFLYTMPHGFILLWKFPITGNVKSIQQGVLFHFISQISFDANFHFSIPNNFQIRMPSNTYFNKLQRIRESISGQTGVDTSNIVHPRGDAIAPCLTFCFLFSCSQVERYWQTVE